MIDPYSSSVLWIVVASFVVGFILAFGIGANSVPNSFATSVGAKVLTVKQACCLGTVFEMAGALLLAYKVSGTVRKGILKVGLYEETELELMLGMFAALIGSSVLLLGATFLKLPVSGSHSIVGATVGFSLVCRGDEGLNWPVLGFIVVSWFLSPVLSGATSVLMFVLVRHFILNASNPVARGLLFLPLAYGVTIFINVFSVLHDGPPLLHLDRIPWWGTLLIGLCAGAVTMLAVQVLLVPFMKRKIEGEKSKQVVTNVDKFAGLTDTDTSRRETTDLGREVLTGSSGKNRKLTASVKCPDAAAEMTVSNTEPTPSLDVAGRGRDNTAFSVSSCDITAPPSTEHKGDPNDGSQVRPEAPPQLFAFLQILAATFASFARGGNDVSNAIGPVIAIWLIYTEGNVDQKSETPLYLLFYGGVGIAVGLWVWGQRVMKTIGEDLTTITSSTGFTIELGAAFTVLLASKIGLPISTQHCKVGSIVFVGCASSTKQGVDWKLFRNIVGAWLVTVPVAGLFSAAAMALLRQFAL